MLNNIGYTFASLEEVFMFVDWVTETFDEPSDFEAFLVEKMPYLAGASADESYISTTTIDPISLMDDFDDDGYDADTDDLVVVPSDVSFWNIIRNGFFNDGNTPPHIPGTN